MIPFLWLILLDSNKTNNVKQDIFDVTRSKPYGTLEKYKSNTLFDEYLIEVLGRYCKPGDVVVDLGCNEGGNLIPLSEKFQVYGVDVKEEFLASVRSKIPDKVKTGRVNLAVWDFARTGELPWPDFQADAIFGTYVLCHISPSHLIEIAPRLTAHLKPGGIFVFTTMEAFDEPLEDWEKTIPSENLGIVCHTLQELEQCFSGCEVLGDSRRFQSGEMRFWQLPEKNTYWAVLRKKF